MLAERLSGMELLGMDTNRVVNLMMAAMEKEGRAGGT